MAEPRKIEVTLNFTEAVKALTEVAERLEAAIAELPQKIDRASAEGAKRRARGIR